MKNCLTFSKVSFAYEKNLILQDVNFDIHREDFVGIIGPNGGGKTTLLKLMMGFLSPLTGVIRLFDHSVKTIDKRKFGYVPQLMRVDKQFPITVLEVVLTGLISQLSFWGRWKKNLIKKAEDTLNLVGLYSFRNKPFGSLSGGQAQRVLIARALANEPTVLFLDEPTASVDPEAQKEIFNVLFEIKKKATLILVTHDFDLIYQHVKRVFYVARTVTEMAPSSLCGHYSLGLFHPPKL